MTVYGNLIEENCNGTGDTITLAGATTGSGLRLPFSSNYSNGDAVPYLLVAQDGTTSIAGVGINKPIISAINRPIIKEINR